jgi:hypothetical protein
MVNIHPKLRTVLFEIVILNAKSCVEKHSMENNASGLVASFEILSQNQATRERPECLRQTPFCATNLLAGYDGMAQA